MNTQLNQEKEMKARKMAEMIVKSSLAETVDTTNDELFLSNKNRRYRLLSDYGLILRACRKSVLDGFPLDEYFLIETPCIEKGYVVAYFDKIDEYGVGDNYNPNAHEIIFLCREDEDVAVPYTECNDGKCVYIEERTDCIEAVYLRGHL